MKSIAKNTYYNVMMPAEGDTEATILIYNYIGEWWSWNPEEGYKQTGTTDIGFVTELNELAEKYAVINVRINCLGGEIFHGNAIVNAILNCKSEVHTWNDGVCASMAAIIWMAGKKRHMAKNGMLMLHSASNICWGNSKEMREMADTLDQFDNSLIIGAADSLGIAEDDLRSNYFDGKDHWLNFNDVKGLGWASPDDNYPSANPLPTDKALNYRDLLAAYEQKVLASQLPQPKNESSDWVPAPLREIFEEAKTAIRKIMDPQSSSSTINDQDMNLEDFKASITDGKLNLDEVKAHIASLAPPAAPVATSAPAEEVEESAAIKALRAEIEAGKEKMTALENRLTAFGAQPGAGRSTPGLPDTDLPAPDGVESIQARYSKANAEMAAAADQNLTPRFVVTE